MSVRIITGSCMDVLPLLKAGSAQMCITSPPYANLRSYLPNDHPDKAKELGSEPTPEMFISNLVAVFREVRRVLRGDGCLVLNLGDSYAGSGKGPTGHNGIGDQVKRQGFIDSRIKIMGGRMRLRVDLTPGERAYVLHELAKARSISDDTQEGRP